MADSRNQLNIPLVKETGIKKRKHPNSQKLIYFFWDKLKQIANTGQLV